MCNRVYLGHLLFQAESVVLVFNKRWAKSFAPIKLHFLLTSVLSQIIARCWNISTYLGKLIQVLQSILHRRRPSVGTWMGVWRGKPRSYNFSGSWNRGGNEQGLVGELTTHRHSPRYPNLLGCPAGHECATHTSRSRKSGQVILPPPNPSRKRRKDLAGRRLTVSCGGNPPPGEVEWLLESDRPPLENPGLRPAFCGYTQEFTKASNSFCEGLAEEVVYRIFLMITKSSWHKALHVIFDSFAWRQLGSTHCLALSVQPRQQLSKDSYYVSRTFELLTAMRSTN